MIMKSRTLKKIAALIIVLTMVLSVAGVAFAGVSLILCKLQTMV